MVRTFKYSSVLLWYHHCGLEVESTIIYILLYHSFLYFQFTIHSGNTIICTNISIYDYHEIHSNTMANLLTNVSRMYNSFNL